MIGTSTRDRRTYSAATNMPVSAKYSITMMMSAMKTSDCGLKSSHAIRKNGKKSHTMSMNLSR